MQESSGAAVMLCGGLDEFAEAAGRWTPEAPFPLLPSEALDRYRALFADGELPPITAGPRAGIVVSVGSEFSRAAAGLLALATARRHLHVPADRLLAELAGRPDQLVAVVGLADELSEVGDWPGASGARVGVLVGRTEQSLICLIYRTLTVESVGEDRFFVSSHPLFRGADKADGVGLSDLDYVRERRVKVLVLRAQGRECCSGVLDSMICGRSQPLDAKLTLPMADGFRSTPCMHGEGCFRTDLAEDELIPAADLNATLIFAHSCSSIAVGTNAFPTEISVSLTMLEGTAVAVIGVIGAHILQRSAQWDLEDGLAEHLALGDITHRLTERSSPMRTEMNRFGLLGDPGLVLDWGDARGTSARSTRERIEVDDETIDRLSHLNDVVLPRLELLRWMGIGIDDDELAAFRARIRRITFDPYDPEAPGAAREVGADLAEMQRQVVERLVDRFYTKFWSFGEGVYLGLRQVSKEDTTCPNCRRPIAVRIVMRHRVESRLHIQSLQCRRCGDVWYSTEPGELTVELGGPVDIDAKRGRPADIERRITNHGDETLRGAVGYAFRSRRYLGLPPAWSQAYELGPGETRTIRAPVDLEGYDPQRDTHAAPFVSLLNGIYTTSMVMMRLL